MSQGGSALDAFVQKRETIAADLHRLEKQVGWSLAAYLGRQNATGEAKEPRPRSCPSHWPQIYELESAYFTADCTNFGNVVKVRPGSRRWRPPPRRLPPLVLHPLHSSVLLSPPCPSTPDLPLKSGL